MSQPRTRAATVCADCVAAVEDPMGLYVCNVHATARKMPSAMILCAGCGFNVERYDIREHDSDAMIPEDTCLRCLGCQTVPKLRESYRRGFNAGLDAMAAAVSRVARDSNLRKGRKDP